MLVNQILSVNNKIEFDALKQDHSLSHQRYRGRRQGAAWVRWTRWTQSGPWSQWPRNSTEPTCRPSSVYWGWSAGWGGKGKGSQLLQLSIVWKSIFKSRGHLIWWLQTVSGTKIISTYSITLLIRDLIGLISSSFPKQLQKPIYVYQTGDTYHTSNGLAVPHKILVSVPAVTIDNLCSGTSVVHGMGRHQVLSVGGPAGSQYSSRSSTLQQTHIIILKYCKGKFHKNDYNYAHR